MKYTATNKFDELGRENNHQNLDRKVFDAFKDGKAVECKPPKWLVEDGYLKKVEAKPKTGEATKEQ